jgi:hypothetical protein
MTTPSTIANLEMTLTETQQSGDVSPLITLSPYSYDHSGMLDDAIKSRIKFNDTMTRLQPTSVVWPDVDSYISVNPINHDQIAPEVIATDQNVSISEQVIDNVITNRTSHEQDKADGQVNKSVSESEPLAIVEVQTSESPRRTRRFGRFLLEKSNVIVKSSGQKLRSAVKSLYEKVDGGSPVLDDAIEPEENIKRYVGTQIAIGATLLSLMAIKSPGLVDSIGHRVEMLSHIPYARGLKDVGLNNVPVYLRTAELRIKKTADNTAARLAGISAASAAVALYLQSRSQENNRATSNLYSEVERITTDNTIEFPAITDEEIARRERNGEKYLADMESFNKGVDDYLEQHPERAIKEEDSLLDVV